MGVKFSKRARHKKKREKDVIVHISVRSNILNDLDEFESNLNELQDDVESMKKRAKDVNVPISVRSNILNDLYELESNLNGLRDDIESIKIQTDEKNNHTEET